MTLGAKEFPKSKIGTVDSIIVSDHRTSYSFAKENTMFFKFDHKTIKKRLLFLQ
jgi:hypothetical protein